jgi:hypothetical protein
VESRQNVKGKRNEDAQQKHRPGADKRAQIWGYHTGEIEGQALKYKIRNPGLL